MYTSTEIARTAKQTRLGLNITQANLAMAAGTGIQFIKDLETGKPTCEIQKVLTVLHALGIKISLTSPIDDANQNMKSELESGNGTRAKRLPLRASRRKILP